MKERWGRAEREIKETGKPKEMKGGRRAERDEGKRKERWYEGMKESQKRDEIDEDRQHDRSLCSRHTLSAGYVSTVVSSEYALIFCLRCSRMAENLVPFVPTWMIKQGERAVSDGFWKDVHRSMYHTRAKRWPSLPRRRRSKHTSATTPIFLSLFEPEPVEPTYPVVYSPVPLCSSTRISQEKNASDQGRIAIELIKQSCFHFKFELIGLRTTWRLRFLLI